MIIRCLNQLRCVLVRHYAPARLINIISAIVTAHWEDAYDR